jgi:hypothetical protein
MWRSKALHLSSPFTNFSLSEATEEVLKAKGGAGVAEGNNACKIILFENPTNTQLQDRTTQCRDGCIELFFV